MTDVFLNILNASFAATWVVLALVLARLLLKRAPRWMVCGLWALVALRLLWPVGIEAPFSLIPSSQIIPPESLFDAAPQINSGISSIDSVINPIYTESLRPTPGASVNPLQVWLAVFANLWLFGVAAMAFWAMISCRRVKRQVRESIPLGGNVFLCDSIPSPFIFGLFRPKIYLPGDLAERTHVLAHERAHLSRRDHWWKPLGFALLAINWFNPAMWLAYILLCRDIELACDERVVKKLPVEEKKAYSAALLACSIHRRQISACPLAFGEVGVKQRVKSVLHYKKPAFWVVLVTVIVAVVLAAGLLTDPETADEIHEPIQCITIEGATFTFDLPEGWEAEPIWGTNYMGFRFRERSNAQGWITVRYWPNQVTAYKYNGTIEERVFPSGLAGEIFYRWYASEYEWDFVYFHNDFCGMTVEKPENYLWDDTYFYETMEVIGTITLTYDGTPLFLAPAPELIDHSWDFGGYTMSVSTPKDWVAQALPVIYDGFYDYIGIRCQPDNREDWMKILFSDTDEVLFGFNPFLVAESITLPSGITGSLYYTNDPARWEHLVIHTVHGRLYLYIPLSTDWEMEDYDTALEIANTLTLQKDGISMLADPNPLGISLRVEGATTRYLKLVCTQEGGTGGWVEILTDPEWTMERLEDGQWVNVMPEDSAWGDIHYQVPLEGSTTWDIQFHNYCGELPEGHYRIGKTFYGHPEIDVIKSTIEATRQVCYAEFDVNPLGITMKATNVNRSGATLVCTRETSLWDEIITGSMWNLQQWNGTEWVNILPESLVWTTEAIHMTPFRTRSFNIHWNNIIGDLEPGLYRAGKTFTGERNPPFTLGISGESYTQTYWAEFTIP